MAALCLDTSSIACAPLLALRHHCPYTLDANMPNVTLYELVKKRECWTKDEAFDICPCWGAGGTMITEIKRPGSKEG